MQLGNVVNDISQNIDCGNSTLKLSTNHDDCNKDPEKSFKDVLSSNDCEGYETDVSSDNVVSDIYFDLSNNFSQIDDSLIQDMSLVDILFINSNIDYQKIENEFEYNCGENTDNPDNSNCDMINQNIEKNLQDFQEILGDNDNKKNVLKNNVISNIDDSNNNDSEFQDDVEFLMFNSINVKESDTKEDLANIVNTEKQVTLDVKIKGDFNDKLNQKVDRKYNEDENIDKPNSLSNNPNQVSNSGKERFVKGDSKTFGLESDNNKEFTKSTFNITVSKSEENIKFIDNTDDILISKSIESRVISDTKNALAECVRSKDGDFNLYLEPKSLGVLKIKVLFKEGNTISVIFNAANPQAINILKQETSDIVNMISSLGFNVNSESLNFNFSQNHSDSNFSRNQFSRSSGDKSVEYIENIDMYKKIWILNDQNVDVLV